MVRSVRSAGSVTPARNEIVHERDEHGSVYAVEVVAAERWDAALLTPPDPEAADARIVRLASGAPPPALPRWLVVERAAVPTEQRRTRSIADVAGVYEVHEGFGARAAAAGAGARAWPWSPSYRGPGAGLSDFLAAGAAALRHPEPAPVEAQRRLELLAEFASAGPQALRRLATLRGDALERWLRIAFGDPERLADEILLQRMSAERPGSPAHEIVPALRFLRAAAVAEGAVEHAELAVDRRVLLEQATPWRYFSGELHAAAVQAVRAWQQRYRLAYERHYRAIGARAAAVAQELRAAAPAAEAVRRFDRIAALGPPIGAGAVAALEGALAALEALPRDPDAQLARTDGVTLGVEPPLFADAGAAVAAVRSALEAQRRRLASETVRAVLARPGVPDLDRLLQAIAASDLDGIERVLSEDLAAHIEQLLREVRESPLATLALRVPRVTAESLDEAALAFRAILEQALAESADGTVWLREDRAEAEA